METAARIGLQLLLHGSLAQGLSDAKNVDEIPVLLLLPTEGGGQIHVGQKNVIFFYRHLAVYFFSDC